MCGKSNLNLVSVLFQPDLYSLGRVESPVVTDQTDLLPRVSCHQGDPTDARWRMID
jgi:hypothetical protein